LENFEKPLPPSIDMPKPAPPKTPSNETQASDENDVKQHPPTSPPSSIPLPLPRKIKRSIPPVSLRDTAILTRGSLLSVHGSGEVFHDNEILAIHVSVKDSHLFSDFSLCYSFPISFITIGEKYARRKKVTNHC
jgi:hypothetical protein